MKPVHLESSIVLDRRATWNEVRCAMSVASRGRFQLASACDDFHEMDSDFSGRACNLPEDMVWLAIVSEMRDSIIN